MSRKDNGAWQINRCDTDFDFMTTIWQTLPIPLRMPAQSTVSRLMRAAQRVIPALHSPSVYSDSAPRPRVVSAEPPRRAHRPARAAATR
jgi:hypothetical protein